MDIPYGIIVAVAASVLLLSWRAATWNRLVRLRNRVRNAWSDIDVQLERRHDLVPNLVEAAMGYMAHERQVLEAVTSARAQALSAGSNLAARIAAEATLTGALGNLMAVAETYPELQAVKNMQLLQEQLATTENRIAFARQFYNESVMNLNTAIATFPRNLIAGMLGFSPATLFAAGESDRANVKGGL